MVIVANSREHSTDRQEKNYISNACLKTLDFDCERSCHLCWVSTFNTFMVLNYFCSTKYKKKHYVIQYQISILQYWTNGLGIHEPISILVPKSGLLSTSWLVSSPLRLVNIYSLPAPHAHFCVKPHLHSVCNVKEVKKKVTFMNLSQGINVEQFGMKLSP